MEFPFKWLSTAVHTFITQGVGGGFGVHSHVCQSNWWYLMWKWGSWGSNYKAKLCMRWDVACQCLCITRRNLSWAKINGITPEAIHGHIEWELKEDVIYMKYEIHASKDDAMPIMNYPGYKNTLTNWKSAEVYQITGNKQQMMLNQSSLIQWVRNGI